MESAAQPSANGEQSFPFVPERLDETPIARKALEVLREVPAALITDVDGTISPIVSTPTAARVLPRARVALRRLRAQLALVAIVSGRSARDARRLVRVGGAVYIGNHGYDISRGFRHYVIPEAREWIPRISSALAAVRRAVECEGVLFEDKGATASIHYRLCPNPEATRRKVLAAIETSADGRMLKVEEGRMVVNLLPPLSVDKGTAVRALADEWQLRGAVYLGDDMTDTHAFRALGDLREQGHLDTLTVAVGNPTWAAEVRPCADTWVPSVEYAAALLDHLAAVLAERPGRSESPTAGARELSPKDAHRRAEIRPKP